LPKKEAVKKNTLILNIAQKMKNRTKWSKH
jgi:hypothetical protein